MRVVVVGAGLGGLSVCEALRGRGHAGDLVLVGEERHPPYDRPPLSKDVLRGEAGPVALRPQEEVDALGLDLRLGRRAVAVTDGPGVVLDDGSALEADAVVLAVGAVPRRLPGTEGVTGVHVLRTHDDALALAAEVEAAGRLVVVGGGFLGVEAALAARSAGRDVLLVEGLPGGPLSRVLGPAVTGRVRALLEDAGVQVRTGAPVEQVVSTGGRVQALVVDGEQVDAPVVLAALGVRPATDGLEALAHEPDGGLRCSATGRTSAPGVWALGDAACWDGVRVEHWTSAMEQAAVVAADVLGEEPPPLGVPYVWSTLHARDGVRTLQALGRVSPATEVEVHDGEAGLVALHGEGDRLTGVAVLEAKRAASKARRLLRAGATLDEARAALLG